MTAQDEGWVVSAHLDLVLDSIEDHAILTLDREGRVTSWNRGAEKTKGYTEAEAIGLHVSAFYLPEDRAADLPMRALALALERGIHEAEGWRLRQDGSRFWAHAVIQPLRDKTGALRGFVKITRDISQKQELHRLQEELQQSQKLDIVGQMTGGIAHDVNNFLTTMDISFDLIRRYANDDRVLRVLDVNRVALDRSRKLTAQLLAFARRQVLHPKLSDINELIAIFDLLLPKAVGEAVTFRLALQADLPATPIDQAQFQSALLSLVVNARDAMPRGGTLTVFSDVVELGNPNFPAPFTVKPGRYVVLGVTDTGIGMPAWVQERAVEPFFTTKEAGKGTGLGLSQCYGFARQSGGTLSIESREGLGTTIRLLLPVAADGNATGDRSERTAGDRNRQARGSARQAKGFERCRARDSQPEAPLAERTVLLVDDDPTVRSLVAESLRLSGHRVIEAEDAVAALDHLHSNVAIDFVITDIIMPRGYRGVELVAEARKIRPDLQALLASGSTRDVLGGTAGLPDDVTFLEKSYNSFDVLSVLAGPAGRGDASP